MASRGRLALAVLLAAVYAVCYAAIKAGLVYSPPLGYAGLRALLAGVALLAVVAIRGVPLSPPRRLWRSTAAIALAGTAVGYAAMFLSPGRTGAGIASVLGNTGPLIIVGLAALVLGEPITRGKLLALVLGFAGVGLIAYPGVTGPDAYGVVGLLLPLVAAMGTATESVLVKRAKVGEAYLHVAAWQLLLGAVPLLVLSTVLERPIVWAPAFVGLLLFLALVGTAFATALWYWLVQHDEVGRLSLVLFLVPVLGLALAWALFGERIDRGEAAGVGLALAGTLVVATQSGRRFPAAKRAASLPDGRGVHDPNGPSRAVDTNLPLE